MAKTETTRKQRKPRPIKVLSTTFDEDGLKDARLTSAALKRLKAAASVLTQVAGVKLKESPFAAEAIKNIVVVEKGLGANTQEAIPDQGGEL